MSKLEFYDGKVVDIIEETKNIRRFFIQIPDFDRLDFVAGQSVKLHLPIDSPKQTRHYSIANAPDGSNVLELLIVLDPNGKGTNYLFNEISIGSTLRTSRVMGNFVGPKEIETDLCFISTGVGLAPLRSMYLDIFNKNIPHKNIYVIFGTRWQKDLVYLDEFKELEEKYPEFKFIPTLSREESPEWTGRKGYVHDIYKELFTDVRPATFYICGWREMVRQTRSNLMEMGYPRKTIHFERFN